MAYFIQEEILVQKKQENLSIAQTSKFIHNGFSKIFAWTIVNAIQT